MAETGAGLFDVGLSTAGGVAALAGGIVALSSGTAAAGTIATLSQTPSGRQMLANWFSQALKSELETINVDPFLQSLYGEVLKAENGIQKAAELMVFNGLVLKGFFGLGFNQLIGREISLGSQTVTVYRVEGAPNQRLVIGENGEVSILGENTLDRLRNKN